MSQALELMSNEQEIMIIGGSTLFEQALPLAQRIYLTRIDHEFAADVFFPKMNLAAWSLTKEYDLSKDEKNEYDLTFCQYERR